MHDPEVYNVAVMASGAGTTLRALVDAERTGALGAHVALLVVSRAEVEVARLGSELEIATEIVDEQSIGAAAADARHLELFGEHAIDLVVLAGYLRMVGPRTIAAFRDAIINTHPAPLPRFGGRGMYGRAVHEAVLASGVAASAATVHRVDAEYDHGEVLASVPVPVLAGDDVETLRARVQTAERALLIATINRRAG